MRTSRWLPAAVVTAGDVGSLGAGQVADRALETLSSTAFDGFWIHLDVDVLDPSIMPAVDSPAPGGLTLDDLRHLLTAPMAAPRARGIDVTIFDPDLDEDGVLAAALTDTIVGAFAQRLNHYG